MPGPNDQVQVIDLQGAFEGQKRWYLRHAAENAVDMGFAKWPDEEGDVEATKLGPDFPSFAELRGMGIETVDAVPATLADLTDIPGIGRTGAKKILKALEG